MVLHIFPIPIPSPTSLSTQSLWVFPVHQVRALVSCIQPGLVISFTLDDIHVSMLFSWNIPPSPSTTESKSLFYTSVSLFLFCIYLNQSSSGIWDWAAWAFRQVFTAVPVSGMLGFLSLPLGWVSFTFSFHSVGFLRLGLLLCLATACGGQAEVASSSHIRVAAPDMSGECVIPSFLSCHSKDLKRRTSVTAQLQLRVYSASKRKAYLWGMRVGWSQRRGLDPLGLLLLYICLLPLLPALCRLV